MQVQSSRGVMSYSSSSLFLFSFFAFPPVSSACHVSPCIPPGSHQFETFRLPTRNERPSGYEQTNGWGRVSNMQSRRTHSSKQGIVAACTRFMHSGPGPILRNKTIAAHHTTPYQTTPHYPRHHTTLRSLRSVEARAVAVAKTAAACSTALRRHHPTPAAAAAVLCRGNASQSPVQVHELCSGRGLGCGCRPWFGRRSVVSRLAAANLHQRCMSLSSTVHIHCVCVHALVPRTCISVRGPFLLKRTGRPH